MADPIIDARKLTQLPALTYPAQSGDLLYVVRGSASYKATREEIIKNYLSALVDTNIPSPSNKHVLLYDTPSGKWVSSFVGWADITSKPSTFPPAEHTHTLTGTKASIEATVGVTGGQAAFATDTGEYGFYDSVTTSWVWSKFPIITHIDMNTAGTIDPFVEGRVSWDPTDGTLSIGMPGGNVLRNLGEEIGVPRRVKNTSGSPMLNGQLVYISGGDGNNAHISLAKADAELTSANTIAMLTENIGNNNFGYATTFGIVRGSATQPINTNAWAPGTVLYLSPTTGGAFTSTKPTAPNHAVSIGMVFRQHATEGSILVNINNGYELEELHDVLISTPITGETLQYDAAGLWKNVNIAGDTKDPTGWVDASNINVSYNSTNRTITLTGDLSYYFHGVRHTLTSPWTSPAHDNINDEYFLYSSDGENFVWSTTTWEFSYLMVAFVNFGATIKFALNELHGLMPWSVHEELHRTIGTYKESGGTLDPASYVLSSSTATDRRPNVVATVVHDEDNQMTLPALTTKVYNKMYLSGAGASLNFTGETAEIVPISGSRPYFNEFTGGAWTQTLMPANTYMSVWLVGVPTTSDIASQAYRYIWVQGQSATNLQGQVALTPSDVSMGSLTSIATEFVFLVKIILQYTGSNWVLNSVTNLSGNKILQVGTPAGVFLSTVATNATLTGDGTLANPLAVVQNYLPLTSLSVAQALDLTDAGDSTLHYHASDRDSANFTGTNWNALIGGATTALHKHDTIGNTVTIAVKDANLSIQDDVDVTKIVKFQVSSLATATTRTWTFPNQDGTFVATTGAQTLTNKTLTAPIITLNTASTTPTAEGDIRWDATNNKIKIGDAATTKTFSADDYNVATFLGITNYSAKGVILAGTGAGTFTSLTVGTDGQVLTADAASAGGVKWATPTATGSAPSNRSWFGI